MLLQRPNYFSTAQYSECEQGIAKQANENSDGLITAVPGISTYDALIMKIYFLGTIITWSYFSICIKGPKPFTNIRSSELSHKVHCM